MSPLNINHWILLLAFSASSLGSGAAEDILENNSSTGHFRVCWNGDPTAEATIAWTQFEGAPGTVYFGTTDQGRRHHLYELKQATHRATEYDGIIQCFARLEELKPDTDYFFCIEDGKGVSPRLKFRTAPDTPQPITFISGGDSRNNRAARIGANLICRQLRPLFIAFTGDMISSDNAKDWRAWLDDWQKMIGDDGNIIPIVAHRGNHERRPLTIYHYFDTPKDAYYAFSIGGSLFRYYALNSEIPADGAQGEWLAKDLKASRESVTHLVAGYHKPMRPHVSKKSEGKNPFLWARTFYENGLDLGIESDSHVVKWTQPIKPDPQGDEGFAHAPNDPNATVFIGEGCWGAPLRDANDKKSWTVDAASFNAIDWIKVTSEGMTIRTVDVDKSSGLKAVEETSSYASPEGLSLWTSKLGDELKISAD
jgi:hypothetical protein